VSLLPLRGSPLTVQETAHIAIFNSNLVNAEFGVQYAASNIEVRFHDIGGQMVCSVNVSKGVGPLFVKDADKNGAKVEKFFIRLGNASKLINDPSEITNYISNRFKAS